MTADKQDTRQAGVVYESPTVEVEDRALRELLDTERWTLEVLDGPERGVKAHFEKRAVTLGSDPLNDLVLTDRTVSRRHCELHRQGSHCRLVDLGSTNGTFLNDLRVGEIYLSHGTVFSVGQTRIRFTVEVERAPLRRPAISRYGDIVGSSEGLRDVFAVLDKVAPTDLSIVIEGETGTGKELIARAIHQRSKRAERPLVVFDCSAFPATLLESELFGHERGAFSGATQTHKGVFERAHGGTIFFDELAEMDVEFQPKFLRVLETGEFRRVGGEKTIKVDVRVVAATNRKLDAMTAQGTFRLDLFYRLAKVRFRLPPLRERLEDLPLLAQFFVDQLGQQLGQQFELSAQALEALEDHDWPGNIRELRNVLERAATMCEGGVIRGDYLRRELGLEPEPARSGGWPSLGTSGGWSALGSGGEEERGALLRAPMVGPAGEPLPLREAKDQLVSDFEKQYLEQLLEKHGQNVSAASREAQVDRRHFYRLLKKYGLMK